MNAADAGLDLSTVIGLASIGVAIGLPIFLRILDYLRYCYRRWRQTENIKGIVHRGIDNILNDNPPTPKSTTPGQVGQDVTDFQVDQARLAYFKELMFNLRVALEDYSADIAYERKRDVKQVLELEGWLYEWHKRHSGQLPPKEVYENFIIASMSQHGWLGISNCARCECGASRALK